MPDRKPVGCRENHDWAMIIILARKNLDSASQAPLHPGYIGWIFIHRGAEVNRHDRWGEVRTPTSARSAGFCWGSFVTPTVISLSLDTPRDESSVLSRQPTRVVPHFVGWAWPTTHTKVGRAHPTGLSRQPTKLALLKEVFGQALAQVALKLIKTLTGPSGYG